MPINSKIQLRVPVLIAVSVLLLARSRLISLAQVSRVNPLLSDKATEQQLKDARQQLYFEERDGSKTLLLPFRGNVHKVGPITQGCPLFNLVDILTYITDFN
jgi:ATP-binding cassette, subfamily D (ALD), peroxisomal long-chain fatty acid import protein